MLAGFTAANAETKIYFEKASYDVVKGGTLKLAVCFKTDLTTVTRASAKYTLTAQSGASGVTLDETTVDKVDGRYTGTVTAAFAGGQIGFATGSANPIIAGEGPLMYIYFTAASDATGSYTFSLTDCGYAIYPTPYDCDEATASVTINVVDYVTIDENEAFEPFALSGKDVKLIRSFEAGKFYSVVLPFDINNATRKAFWGSDVEAYVLNGCTFNEDTDEMIVGVTFNFTKAGNKTTLTAHVPFLVKPSQTVEDGTFTSVTMSAVSGVPQQSYADKGTGIGSGYGSNIVFVGTYAPETVVPTDALYLKGSMLYSSTGGTKMKGTRAYIDLSDVYAKLDEYILTKDFVMSFDGEETAIDQIDADLKAEGWYDLNGRKLAEKPAMKGIYINNGKKVVVK